MHWKLDILIIWISYNYPLIIGLLILICQGTDNLVFCCSDFEEDSSLEFFLVDIGLQYQGKSRDLAKL